MSSSYRVPIATYRFQFNRDFRFEDATALVPYLDDLGVSDLYASPYLQARTGSVHGYDISDHGSLNREIGTREEYDAMTDALRDREMGHLLDIVPNHMGIGEPGNRWWMDVLEHGPSSPYARYFDIDWRPLDPALENRVLLPVLGGTFGSVLERGELRIERKGGIFRLHYFENVFPLSPRSLTPLLREALDELDLPDGAPARLELESVATSLENLPPRNHTTEEAARERHRERVVAARRLEALVAESEEVRTAVDGAVTTFNGVPGEPASFDLLESLLNDQAYRLAYWRVAAEEINYRRFFDINDLAGVRVERDDVFRDTHRLILSLLEEGRVTGLRIDHPDGLYDPEAYLERLRQEGRRRTERDPYVLVEKILTGPETLPESWPVAGTVGYAALNRISGLFVPPENEARMDGIYRDFTGRDLPFEELAYRKKMLALRASLSSELNVLSHLLHGIAREDRHTRDFTEGSLTGALAEVIACFPVYRTYVDAEAGDLTERDTRYVVRAVREARRRDPSTSRSVYDFIADTLLLRWPEGLEWEERRERVRFVMKFQQLTGPVMAKGVEDTSFYVFNRLVSLNEVGGEPAEFGINPEHFHEWFNRRARVEPHAMTSSSTHDTKRSEDVRARIHLLAEIPDEWEAAVRRWGEMNSGKRQQLEDGICPDPNDEYLLYQTLIGAWPLDPPGDGELSAFTARIQQYMEKATREAKTRTSWVNPDEEYDEALQAFIAHLLDPERSADFIEELSGFQEVTARLGMVNALAQTVLKLTVPGVPDIYQGQELWDLSLVDPDNRRPVDYDMRRRLLEELPAADPDAAEALYGSWRDGRIKLFVIRVLLGLRQRDPELFAAGDYTEIPAEGERSEHVVAFRRRHGGREMVTVVPRLVGGLTRPTDFAAPDAAVWGYTRLALEGDARFREVLTGREIRRESSGLPLSHILGHLPVAVLYAEGS